MQSLVQSDIFFFVTTIAIIVVTAGFSVAIIYIVRILKDVKDLSEKAKDEGGRILDDVRALRQDVKSRSVGFSDILSLVGFIRKRRKAKKEKKEE